MAVLPKFWSDLKEHHACKHLSHEHAVTLGELEMIGLAGDGEDASWKESKLL